MSGKLVVFVKNPVAGKVKTRLAKTIGDQAALEAYLKLQHYTKKIILETPFDLEVHYASEIDHNDLWSEKRFKKDVQLGSDLGLRMNHVFEQSSHQKTIIIGSDCAELNSGILINAFDSLEKHDVVIGPARDGGYYLIGMKEAYPSIFDDKEWSTDQVFKEAISEVEKLGLSYHLLPTLSDVDTIDDWLKVKDLI